MAGRDSFGWGGGLWGRRQRRRRDQGGWRERQTQPRALSGFLLLGSKPLHILADLQTAGVCSACCLPACPPLRYARPPPALPSPSLTASTPTPHFTPPLCVPGRGSCAGRSGIRNAGGHLLWAPSLLPLRAGALDSLPIAFQEQPQYNLVSLLGLQKKKISLCVGGSILCVCVSLVSEAACLSSLVPLQLWQPLPFLEI